MENRLHKATLKVFGYDFAEGREQLEGLVENDERRYPLWDSVSLSVFTNQGNLHIATGPGFAFDGRSGPSIIDWYVPNLGTFEERICWFVHDCNGYGQDLSFKDTNVLLYVMLRDLCRYRKTKATMIQLAVSLSDDWYGPPRPDEWCYQNRKLVSSLFLDKLCK